MILAIDHSHVDPFLPHFKETKAQVLAQEQSAWAAAAASQGVAEARLKERKKKLSWPGMQERETRLKVAEWKRNPKGVRADEEEAGHSSCSASQGELNLF